MSSRSQRGRRVAAALTLALAVAVTPQTQAQVPTPRPTPGGPVPVERVTIEYSSGTFRVVSRVFCSSVLVPSSELPAENASGFWFELRNSDEGVRYRRGTGNPLFLVFEGAG